jgi:hypothetical protein
MSAAETKKAFEGLSEEQLQRAADLQTRIEALKAELEAVLGQSEAQKAVVDLPSRGIDETQASDLRARLKTFSEDWDRPETAVYDQSPPR